MARVLWALALISIAALMLGFAWYTYGNRQVRTDEIEIHRFEFHPNGETPTSGSAPFPFIR